MSTSHLAVSRAEEGLSPNNHNGGGVLVGGVESSSTALDTDNKNSLHNKTNITTGHNTATTGGGRESNPMLAQSAKGHLRVFPRLEDGQTGGEEVSLSMSLSILPSQFQFPSASQNTPAIRCEQIRNETSITAVDAFRRRELPHQNEAIWPTNALNNFQDHNNNNDNNNNIFTTSGKQETRDNLETNLPSNRVAITSKPTLVPNADPSSRVRGETGRTTENTTDRTATWTSYNREKALVDPWDHSRSSNRGNTANIHTNTTTTTTTTAHIVTRAEHNNSITQSSTPNQQSSLSTAETLSRPTMGYNSTIDTSPAWNAEAEGEKMESSTIQTASERTHEGDDDDDDTTIHSVESGTEGPATPQYGYAIPDLQPAPVVGTPVGTPSTLSTAPSTDDASLNMDPATLERMSLRLEAGMPASSAYHRRVPSWEGLPHSVHHNVPINEDHHYFGPPTAAAHSQPQGAWGHPRVPMQQQQQQQPIQHHQQRVASFRPEQQGYPPMAPRWAQQPQQQPPHPHPAAQHPQVPFLPGRGENRSYRQTPFSNPYQMAERRPATYTAPPLPPSATPPRSRTSTTRLQVATNSPRYSSQSSGQSPSTSGSGGARSSSEILKTLLRKKACLYEPDTSRAVTLITWLVGRHLALENGFFSRQQLQAGVHSCVAHKIESGVITRTKVNRCMQIILNSCFHYIIPRPDGTEENGEAFRKAFAAEVSDDEFLLKRLPVPWNDMVVSKEAILQSMQASKVSSPISTPQSSPQLSSVNAADKLSPGKDSVGSSDREEGKRAVLLCFNENVRSAEDVFRCHNEFIHDTAHASNLQLSSLEWRQFFGKEAASAPYLWGNVGIPITHQEGKDQTDALGVMTNKEVCAFRTSWCAKRYDHNHELCGFAHSHVNGGWLRRNPSVYHYKDEMCPSISKLSHGRVGSKILILNECPHGVDCTMAHSVEEIIYHPARYKGRLCQSASRPGGCSLGDICPHFHPLESYKFPKKPDSRSPRHARQQQQQQASAAKAAAAASCPSGSPIMYASPAPVSSFEQQLLTPGLKNLYRRHCSVARALMRNDQRPCYYSCFGDDVEGSSPRRNADGDDDSDNDDKESSSQQVIGGMHKL